MCCEYLYSCLCFTYIHSYKLILLSAVRGHLVPSNIRRCQSCHIIFVFCFVMLRQPPLQQLKEGSGGGGDATNVEGEGLAAPCKKGGPPPAPPPLAAGGGNRLEMRYVNALFIKLSLQIPEYHYLLPELSYLNILYSVYFSVYLYIYY